MLLFHKQKGSLLSQSVGKMSFFKKDVLYNIIKVSFEPKISPVDFMDMFT